MQYNRKRVINFTLNWRLILEDFEAAIQARSFNEGQRGLYNCTYHSISQL